MILQILFALNILSFLLFAYDKRCAVHHAWRVPERTLLLVCFFGGAVGGYLAMWVCHHKTRKWKFKLAVPLVMVIHAILWFAYTHVS